MTPQESPIFLSALTVLSEIYGSKLSENACSLYFDLLADLPLMHVLSALRESAKRNKFMPRPAEIRELILGNANDASELAWLDVLREVRRVGSYGTPTFTAEISSAVRAVWGTWEHLCATLPADGPELLGWAKRFKSAYEVMDTRAQRALLDSQQRNLLED